MGIWGINFKDKYAVSSNCHERQLFLINISPFPPHRFPRYWASGKAWGKAVCVSIANLDPHLLSVIIFSTEVLRQLRCWGPTLLSAPISLFTLTTPPPQACGFADLQRKLIKQTISSAMCDVTHPPPILPIYTYTTPQRRALTPWVMVAGLRSNSGWRNQEDGGGGREKKIKIQFVVSLWMIHWKSEPGGLRKDECDSYHTRWKAGRFPFPSLALVMSAQMRSALNFKAEWFIEKNSALEPDRPEFKSHTLHLTTMIKEN